MSAQLKLATPNGYRILGVDGVIDYLAGSEISCSRLGGKPAQWTAREVGDGNLNLVFIVEGPEGAVVVKQALPYVRLVGESWPLPLARAHYEHLALAEQGRWAPEFVPEIYEHDSLMSLTVMEYLSPHIILRKGLIRGIQYPHMAEHLGKFLARTLYHTSDLYLPAAQKKEKIAQFLTNTAMCKISEDLIFDEPYFDAPMNRHTTPQLDDMALEFRQDAILKAAVQDMKWRFLNHAEAMIHGDLHTGSIMVTPEDTRVIDPEFSFYGPMGFDVGAILGNLLIAYYAQAGHGNGDANARWILRQIEALWTVFLQEFTALAINRSDQDSGGDALHPRLYKDAPGMNDKAVAARVQAIWSDALGFAGCKMIRRILGLAHVEDFESIADPNIRADCEKKAMIFARRLVVDRGQFQTIFDVTKAAL